MTKRRLLNWACSVLLFSIGTGAPSQTFQGLLNLDGNDGTSPVAGLIQGTDGAYYGTAISGGANDWGSVFKITSDGVPTTLYSFCSRAGCADGAFPSAGLTETPSGNFYGTTAAGGANQSGAIFRVSPEGEFSTVYSFCAQTNCTDGSEPLAGLVQSTDGDFYGTTNAGGADGAGIVFKVTREGVLTTLHSFCLQGGLCSDGSFPTAGLVEGNDGNFYGTTSFGGTCGIDSGCGTGFKISSEGMFTTLYSFCTQANCADGSRPVAGLVQGSDGNLYGTTYAGGVHGAGTVFKLTLRGKLTTIYSFCAETNCADGAEPDATLIQATDGNLYGTTQYGGNINCNTSYEDMGCGTLFSINTHGGHTTLHVFDFTDGAYPESPLTQATTGKLYGTTYGGGNLCGERGCGTIFRLDLGLGRFVAFVRAAGKVGQTGPILGEGFTGTTNVSINGVQAHFAVVSDTDIRATVPEGARTGYVIVDTPSGKLTSNVPFHVIP
jgi:uncharacterized repeat protein (TIGR03803 family)